MSSSNHKLRLQFPSKFEKTAYNDKMLRSGKNEKRFRGIQEDYGQKSKENNLKTISYHKTFDDTYEYIFFVTGINKEVRKDENASNKLLFLNVIPIYLRCFHQNAGLQNWCLELINNSYPFWTKIFPLTRQLITILRNDESDNCNCIAIKK